MSFEQWLSANLRWESFEWSIEQQRANQEREDLIWGQSTVLIVPSNQNSSLFILLQQKNLVIASRPCLKYKININKLVFFSRHACSPIALAVFILLRQ